MIARIANELLQESCTHTHIAQLVRHPIHCSTRLHGRLIDLKLVFPGLRTRLTNLQIMLGAYEFIWQTTVDHHLYSILCDVVIILLLSTVAEKNISWQRWYEDYWSFISDVTLQTPWSCGVLTKPWREEVYSYGAGKCVCPIKHDSTNIEIYKKNCWLDNVYMFPPDDPSVVDIQLLPWLAEYISLSQFHTLCVYIYNIKVSAITNFPIMLQTWDLLMRIPGWTYCYETP